MPEKPRPPGSNEALNAGCSCPVLDNAHGAGAYVKDGEPQFWINGDCPIHTSKEQNDDTQRHD